MRNSGKQGQNHSSMHEKANVVLNLILIGFIIIAVRIWHLSVVEYDEKFEQSRKPQRKTIIEPAKRATIRDRFNIPLALNKIVYSAGVSYSPIRQVPATVFEYDASGNKVKKFKRKEYIHDLAVLLSSELGLDEKRVEDLIYAKAALYFNIPYILKYEISEAQYYRLRMLEKDWPGLTVQKYSKREYPGGSSAADIVGYMGAISREEYEKIILEKKSLEEFLLQWEKGEDPPYPLAYTSLMQVRKRYNELESLAYKAQDSVGKTGIESLFEQQLRGFQGKRTFYADSKGNLLQELPGSHPPTAGKRIILSISQELQEYAEILLAQNEEVRIARSMGHGKKIKNQKQPWIKGGGIVVLDPKSGEVLTLATYPRFDPNDFLANKDTELGKLKNAEINKWFENDSYLADLWNEQLPLEKELYNASQEKFYMKKKWITWETFLELLLPKDHPIVTWFNEHPHLEDVIRILQVVDDLESQGVDLKKFVRDESLQNHPLSHHLSFLSTPYTKLLFLDCCQLAVDHSAFSKELVSIAGRQTIQAHKEAGSAYFALKNEVRQIAKEIFHREIFTEWRTLNEKKFLKEKREEEKQAKTYPKPYIDYLDAKEHELFATFWERVSTDFCQILLEGKSSYTKENCFTSYFKQLNQELNQGAHPALSWRPSYDKLQNAVKDIPKAYLKAYLATLRSYEDLKRPLKGKYRSLRNRGAVQVEKHLASSIYPTYGHGYGRSYAYRQASTQGSIFKMVTAHETLLQTNEESLKAGKGIKNFNPLEIMDETFKLGNNTFVGYNSAGKAIPQLYKGGRLPRSHSTRMGKMDLMHAVETSSNPYFSILAGDILKNPNDLAEAARKFGFGRKTGIELPGEIAGSIPKDLETNRTGLYAMAIGQHTLVVTPIQTALFLSSLANGGELLKPRVVKYLVGSSIGHSEDWLYAELDKENQSLKALGIDFPLFDSPKTKNKISVENQGRAVVSTVEMHPSLRNTLLEGMRRVVKRTHQESLVGLSRLYQERPEAISDYVDLKNQIIGKTSTSESMERIDLDEEEGTNLYTHTWFGGISFEKDVGPSFENPELVVVVYLRYGAFGKEAAPLAAQIVRKWREIKESHSGN